MFGLSPRQVVSSFVGSTLHKFDLLAKLMVPFLVKLLAPGCAVEDKAAPKATVHIGIQIALGARTQVMSLRQRIVQFRSRQVQHRVRNRSIVVRVRSGSGGCGSRWSFNSQWTARRRLGAAHAQQQVGAVSSIHASVMNRSVSNGSLSALGHGEQQTASIRHSCFEYRVDQVSENDLRVLGCPSNIGRT